MSYEPDKCLDDLCEMKQTIMDGFKAELANGVHNVNTEEAYKVVDIIKDLAETERNCLESEYYKAVIEAMGQDNAERYGYLPNDRWTYRDVMGYNNRHYGNGRFATRGSGTMGYNPTIRQMPYIRDYLDNPEEFSRDMRMGYHDPDYNERYGRAYNEYKTAKRYYTENHTDQNKIEMNRHATEHLTDTIATIRDIWSSADSDMKKRMKADLSGLLGEMGS